MEVCSFWCKTRFILLQALICYETAALHPFISEKEREHLNAENSPPKRKKDSQLQVWLSIIKSIPVIALIAAQVNIWRNSQSIITNEKNKTFQVGYDWGFYSMISHLPRFIYTNIFALEFPPKPFNFQDIGLLSSLPFLFMWIVAVLSIFCSERLTTRNINITILVRKIFVCIGKFSLKNIIWKLKINILQLSSLHIQSHFRCYVGYFYGRRSVFLLRKDHCCYFVYVCNGFYGSALYEHRIEPLRFKWKLCNLCTGYHSWNRGNHGINCTLGSGSYRKLR